MTTPLTARSPPPLMSFTHLLQVGVTPYLAISKHPGDEPAQAIILQPLSGRASLQSADLPAAGAAHIYWQQLAAGNPEYRVARCVVYNLQQELSVVIIYLLRPQGTIIIDGEDVPPVYLEGKIKRRKYIQREYSFKDNIKKEKIRIFCVASPYLDGPLIPFQNDLYDSCHRD